MAFLRTSFWCCWLVLYRFDEYLREDVFHLRRRLGPLRLIRRRRVWRLDRVGRRLFLERRGLEFWIVEGFIELWDERGGGDWGCVAVTSCWIVPFVPLPFGIFHLTLAAVVVGVRRILVFGGFADDFSRRGRLFD